jgi:hypothetical protein
VLSHRALVEFLSYYESLPDGPHTVRGTKAYANDDSSINEWVTHHAGLSTLHPVPTIVEHRSDVDSTVGHGDQYSRERISWRTIRGASEKDGKVEWIETALRLMPDAMFATGYWDGADSAPMLELP